MAVTKCVKNGVILLTVDAKRVFFETKEMQFSSCNNYSVQKFEIKFSQLSLEIYLTRLKKESITVQQQKMLYCRVLLLLIKLLSRDGAVVRTLASHRV